MIEGEAAAVNPVRGIPSSAGLPVTFGDGGDAASSLAAHMRIQLSDAQLVPNLLAFLCEHAHVTAENVGPQEIEVSQLGSQHAAGRRLELELLLQLWRTSHERAETRILD